MVQNHPQLFVFTHNITKKTICEKYSLKTKPFNHEIKSVRNGVIECFFFQW